MFGGVAEVDISKSYMWWSDHIARKIVILLFSLGKLSKFENIKKTKLKKGNTAFFISNECIQKQSQNF